MLGIRTLSSRWSRGEHESESSPGALIATVGIDVAIDGVLVGIGFAAGLSEGRLLAFALAIEGLTLGLVTTLTLLQTWRRGRSVLISASLGLLFVIGGLAGASVLANLSSHAISLALAFGLAALLFLVTEELLVEAHEVPETPLITSLFFVGFLLFMLIG
ncbi:MAG: hypothetical protein R2849_07480 [Thermomicrobiales bacterium]